MYLGDYKEDDTLYFAWSSNDSDGASITRATDGTISVYKDDGTTQSVAGITDTEDFDSVTGIHMCKIILTDAFYVTGSDYAVVLSAATIDSQTVNAVLAHFSIENRFTNVSQISGSATAADNLELSTLAMITGAAVTGTLTNTTMTTDLTEVTDDHYNGRIILFTSGNLIGQVGVITDYTGSSKLITFTPATATDIPANGDDFIIL